MNDRVIIEPKELTQTVSGIEVPFQSKTGVGTVIAVGPDVKDIFVGETVYHSLAYDEIEVDGKEFRVVYTDDIYAIYEEGKN
jgi:co-chaperonin GroES (HSP10)